MILKLGQRLLNIDQPIVMGVLNITPDSFSDGGQFKTLDDALSHGGKLLRDGASIIDVGGESTRPGSQEISVQEELDRVIPVIGGIADRFDVALSIDTSKPDVMRAAVAAGAVMINDIYALQKEGALSAAKDVDAAVCLVHMQGSPQKMQHAPRYNELITEIVDFLGERVAACIEGGIDRKRLLIDPGFGFGKKDRHNLQILANLAQFSVLGMPLLVGLSRKRTLGNLTGKPVEERVAAGVAAALHAVAKGARIIRTHDVAETVDALTVFDAIKRAAQG